LRSLRWQAPRIETARATVARTTGTIEANVQRPRFLFQRSGGGERHACGVHRLVERIVQRGVDKCPADLKSSKATVKLGNPSASVMLLTAFVGPQKSSTVCSTNYSVNTLIAEIGRMGRS
jgi:hypothetical protein